MRENPNLDLEGNPTRYATPPGRPSAEIVHPRPAMRRAAAQGMGKPVALRGVAGALALRLLLGITSHVKEGLGHTCLDDACICE